MHPKWLLPEFVDDVLPKEAQRVELIRRTILDSFASYGYELVSPPLIEYLESLLTGSGKDLELQTFKLVDQMSGKMLGIRADVTPQIARLDSHLLGEEGVTRLCYADRVLRTRPIEGDMSREVVQIGAELFGCSGIFADIEINRLLIQSIRSVVKRSLTLDLGSVSIAQSVSNWLALNSEASTNFYEGLQSKDTAALEEFSKDFDDEARKVIMALPTLYGDFSVLDEARTVLVNVPGASRGIDQLESVYQAIKDDVDHVAFDLAELRGFQYHSGLVVAVYVEGDPTPIARGGRYDHVGEAFGRSRPATGFTIDLRRLSVYASEFLRVGSQRKVWAPCVQNEPELKTQITELRRDGDIVVEDLLGQSMDLSAKGYTHTLVKDGRGWSLVAIDNKN
ncbi:MAG: ATP phosphoribosyltransferase regulatory subunit [Proteobacteria bacterium]|nr:ATP phosphoribosyltransferase regulatory subunit [Pseudomonadota bacterium]MDA1331892.1 ATP phosphoribosyltransferase regulatory subunit [Pseudomonadota bacterium]